MAIRVVLVGTGGWGRTWCKNTLPGGRAKGLVDIVGAVDMNPDNLKNAEEFMGLSPEQCFADLETALNTVKADACVISVRPENRLELCRIAFEHGCDVLCEKPFADTMEAAIEIKRLSEQYGCRVGVTMSHRFSRRMATFRREVNSGKYGPLMYLVCNFAGAEARTPLAGTGGRVTREEDAIFTEGAMHQIDYLRDLSGGECTTVYATAGRAPWSSICKFSMALVNMKFDSDTAVQYEFSYSNAASLYSWGHDILRAELRDATIVMTEEEVRIYPYEENKGSRTPTYYLADNEPGSAWGNSLLLEKFVKWVEGGEPMETNIQDNIRSFALVHAIIRACKTGKEVDVPAFMKEYGL